MVTTFPAHEPVTPVGKPVTVAPVAPVVVWVMFVKGVLIHKVGVLDGNPTVLFGVTVIVPVVVAGGQPPVVVTV